MTVSWVTSAKLAGEDVGSLDMSSLPETTCPLLADSVRSEASA